MTPKPDPNAAPPERLSLTRWSRRKLDAARTEDAASAPAQAVPSVARNEVSSPAAPLTNVPATAASQAASPELPPVDSLTPESDFTGFFQPQAKVEEALKRAALKQLLRDPRFNVMDGLDIYVGDYTKSDPIPDDVLKRLVQARAIFNPPKTMVNAQGHVVDVPPDADAPVPEATAAPIESAPATTVPPVALDTPNADADGDRDEHR
jgi:Protein of unknown function (DUF3306)